VQTLASGHPSDRSHRVKDAAQHTSLPEWVRPVSDDPDVPRTVGKARPSARIGCRSARGWLIVALPPEIDVVNADEVLADLLAAIDCGIPVVIADLGMTVFCDCAGVSALLTAATRALEAGVRLRAVARSEPLLRVFGLTRLDGAVPVYPTNAAALYGCGDGDQPSSTRRDGDRDQPSPEN
jgi:anti-anti-sigma factor